MPNILYIVTEYSGGMRPYALSILQEMWNTNSFAIIVYREEQLKDDFRGFDLSRILFIPYPKSKLKRLLFRFIPFTLLKAIRLILKKNHINIVHTLTGEIVLAYFLNKVTKGSSLLHTVHDAIPHDTVTLSLSQRLNEKFIIEIPNTLLIKKINSLITNSNSQYNYLRKIYPNKKIYYSDFPTLITDTIINGEAIVPELKQVPNYLLFFGNINLYKGVDILYQLYSKHPELKQWPLVIAGNGPIYFERAKNEENIYFINRYIRDEEIKNLFSKAALVIYPYRSATQSGVTSLASFFGKKMILSQVPFFKEIATNEPGISLVNIDKENEFINSIQTMIASSENTFDFYTRRYTNQKKIISAIYDQINE